MISNDIQELIDKVKAGSNSLERNKILSKLEDARAWAIAAQVKWQDAPHPADQCTCMPGATDKSCTVHS